MKVFTLYIAGAILLTFGLTRLVHDSRSHAQDEPSPVVVNETEAFQVESLTANKNSNSMRYTLKLKNVSSKRITAYAVQYPSGAKQSADYASTGGGIDPGSVQEIEITDSLRTAISDQPKKITIKLALFEDGSSEGDFKDQKVVVEGRLGMKIQLERINKILQEALSFKQGDTKDSEVSNKKWLDQVISTISDLSVQPPPGKGEEVGSGLHTGKELALLSLKALKGWQEMHLTNPMGAKSILSSRGEIAGTLNLQDGITKIIHFNEVLISRHKEVLDEK